MVRVCVRTGGPSGLGGCVFNQAINLDKSLYIRIEILYVLAEQRNSCQLHFTNARPITWSRPSPRPVTGTSVME